VHDFVDESWDERVRNLVAGYLANGTILACAAGVSRCRLCGKANGSAEFTDGVYMWPEGLAHYVGDHSVRPPKIFIDHVRRTLDELENAHCDVDWWRSVPLQ
jgi:hypothetical protein